MLRFQTHRSIQIQVSIKGKSLCLSCTEPDWDQVKVETHKSLFKYNQSNDEKRLNSYIRYVVRIIKSKYQPGSYLSGLFPLLCNPLLYLQLGFFPFFGGSIQINIPSSIDDITFDLCASTLSLRISVCLSSFNLFRSPDHELILSRVWSIIHSSRLTNHGEESAMRVYNRSLSTRPHFDSSFQVSPSTQVI